jgi:hypothetical protein
MPDPARKPPVKIEPLPGPQSLEPHSIRYAPRDWDRLTTRARRRHLEPSVYARVLTLTALRLAEAQDEAEESVGRLAEGRL